MAAWVYFIGGAVASGKSTAAADLGRRHGLNVVRLDDYFDVLTNHGLAGDPLAKATRTVIRMIICELVNSGAKCIVEGAWLLPEQAAVLRSMPAFDAVFCGYPRANPTTRLAQIWANRQGSVHWLSRESKERATRVLTNKIGESDWIQTECRRLQIPFVDFSDFDEGRMALDAQFDAARQTR